ncbi:MAG: hypothetical protein MJ025_05150 [Victivallaceae bacterium]|nr:hypothetical protein [Victivallaceae bacterium]
MLPNTDNVSSGRPVRRVVVVTGPTATGKTRLAVELARRFGGEIVSVDSRQVYRGLDIGSGKDIAEYGEVPYHLIDVADPAKGDYNLFRFCHDAFEAVGDISSRGKLPVLCGGSPLYLAALLEDYRMPVRADGHVSFMAPFALDPLVLGVLYPREEVRDRIEKRLDARLESGMVGEVRDLVAGGVSHEQLERFGLEYREISLFLAGKCDRETMRRTLLDRIRQFAKRQDIFFRKLEREGNEIRWIMRGDAEEASKLVQMFLDKKELPAVGFRLCEFRNPPSGRNK